MEHAETPARRGEGFGFGSGLRAALERRAPDPADAAGDGPVETAHQAQLVPIDRLYARLEVSAEPADEAAAPASAILLFVPSPSGYALVEREGPAPSRGDTLQVGETLYAVCKIGPSPLPQDGRPCVCLHELA